MIFSSNSGLWIRELDARHIAIRYPMRLTVSDCFLETTKEQHLSNCLAELAPVSTQMRGLSPFSVVSNIDLHVLISPSTSELMCYQAHLQMLVILESSEAFRSFVPTRERPATLVLPSLIDLHAYTATIRRTHEVRICDASMYSESSWHGISLPFYAMRETSRVLSLW